MERTEPAAYAEVGQMPGHGEPCRHCDGTGVWHPQAPQRDAQTGAVSWVTVEEPCRMCVGTGRHMHENCALPPIGPALATQPALPTQSGWPSRQP